MTYRLRCKVWLENEAGMPIMGKGRLRIFHAIRQTGSILKAARLLRQPYRNVWAKIKDAERQCGFKIVETSRNGSRLTPEGARLIHTYDELQRACKKSTQAKFRRLFSASEHNVTETGTRDCTAEGRNE